MVTITDIARRLGVAVSTVSKGLNGANDVSESTRALILKTAVEMGYAGRKVQKSGVRKVCVLAEREEFLSAGQFGYDLAMGFRTTAAQNGWQADLAPFQGLLSSQEALDTFLLRHNYAGAFLIKQPLDSFFQSNYLKNLINSAFPLVFWEEESNGPCSGSVGSDHRRGVFMAVEHLCQLGHKRIALLNGLPDFPLSGLWATAYRDALEVLQLTSGHPVCRLPRRRKRPPLCGPAFVLWRHGCTVRGQSGFQLCACLPAGDGPPDSGGDQRAGA